MNSKAQAGLEYLITYGWALVLVTTVVGVLVLLVGGPLGEEAFSSSDPTKLLMKGGLIDPVTQTSTIKLQNVTGGKIEIQAATGGDGFYDCDYVPKIVGSGSELELSCHVEVGTTTGTVDIKYMDVTGILQSTLISGGGTVPMGAPPDGENTDYLCSDGYNNDTDSLIDCEDPDCDTLIGCDPNHPQNLCPLPTIKYCEFDEEKTCDDSFDNDADGDIDDADSDCVPPVELCEVIGDEDMDELADCLDTVDCSDGTFCDGAQTKACWSEACVDLPINVNVSLGTNKNDIFTHVGLFYADGRYAVFELYKSIDGAPFELIYAPPWSTPGISYGDGAASDIQTVYSYYVKSGNDHSAIKSFTPYVPECTDTDVDAEHILGHNYEVKGTLLGNTDSCDGRGRLIESWCSSSGTRAWGYHVCENEGMICDNGICVTPP